jgi:hypothetical protein
MNCRSNYHTRCLHPPTRRLLGVIVSLFVGATAGTLLLVHATIYAPVLPFVIAVLVVAIAAIVWSDGGRPRDSNRIRDLIARMVLRCLW